MTETEYDLSATFVAEPLAPDAFSVVSFEGREAISEPFRFEITLISDDPAVDVAGMVGRVATFEIVFQSTRRTVHGVVEAVEQGDPFLADRYLYRATLVPRVAGLAHSRGYQIHLDRTVPQIVVDELLATNRQGLKEIPQLRLAAEDVSISLMASDYAALAYRCQFGETDLDYISRLMEYEGLFYYFVHKDDRDVIVIGDDNIFFQGADYDLDCEYQRGDLQPYLERIYSFRRRQRRVPETVLVNDYNYMTPDRGLVASAAADPNGTGAVHLFGEHHPDAGTGARIARVRAQEAAWQKVVLEGAGHHVSFEPGRQFSLKGHFRDDLNGDYRIVSIRHSGRLRVQGAPAEAAPDEEPFGYRNAFECIPSAVPFRPRRVTPRPRVDGLLEAHIDAEGEGHVAVVDDYGRYRVRMPFDLSGRPDGSASSWIRLATPLAGSGEGVHFPLRKGTEVLVAHVLGDPDRPVIVAAVPNPGTVSKVTKINPASSVIGTASGMRLALHDAPGVTHPISRVPPLPAMLSTIGAAEGGAGGGAGAADGGATQAAPVGAAVAATTPRPNALSAAASETDPPPSGDYIEQTNKSVQISVPDYKTSGDDSLDSYLRIGGSPPSGSGDLQMETDRLVETLQISEEEATTVLTDNDIGWFDFTDGGRVSFTEGFKIDRLHEGSTVYAIEYSSALSEEPVAWGHSLFAFKLETTVGRTMEYFAGTKTEVSAAEAIEISATLGMKIEVASEVAISAGFSSEVSCSVKMERSYGPEVLEVHDGNFEQVSKSIRLMAAISAQQADEVQQQSTNAFIASTILAGVLGGFAGIVDLAETDGAPASEDLLTSTEKSFLNASTNIDTGLLAAALVENVAMMTAYTALKAAMAVEEAAHPPTLELDSTTSEATLSSGVSSITVTPALITIAVGETAIELSAAGIALSTDGAIQLEVGDTSIVMSPANVAIASTDIAVNGGAGLVNITAGVVTVGSAESISVALSANRVSANGVSILPG